MAFRTFSATLSGISGVVIEVEAARQNALPQIHITGLPGEIIKESRERVRACLNHLGFDVPSSRLVVNLSPAGARKQGSQFDLAIAVSVLMAEGFLKNVRSERLALLGELSLDGRVLRVPGVMGLIEPFEARDDIDMVLVPRENLWEANLMGSRKARPIRHIAEVIEFLSGKREIPIEKAVPPEAKKPIPQVHLDDVIGQHLAKRSLQIALAGHHHLLFLGTPGVGKSLLASCAPSLLPPLLSDDWTEVVKNFTYCPDQRPADRVPPFRAPHHSISGAGLLGGGSGFVIPGEVTLAHAGILFLDELPEFRSDVIDGLREPLQVGTIQLNRIGHAIQLPAKFILIAAMNPCPCGYSSVERRCHCSSESIIRYQRRISGAVIDRLDLSVVLAPPKRREWKSSELTYSKVKESIARVHQLRWRRNEGRFNGELNVKIGTPPFDLDAKGRDWLEALYDSGSLSFRSLHKIARVARTIADLEGGESIRIEHLQEAKLFRCSESYVPLYR